LNLRGGRSLTAPKEESEKRGFKLRVEGKNREIRAKKVSGSAQGDRDGRDNATPKRFGTQRCELARLDPLPGARDACTTIRYAEAGGQ